MDPVYIEGRWKRLVESQSRIISFDIKDNISTIHVVNNTGSLNTKLTTL